MDAKIKQEMLATMRAAMIEMMEGNNEVYLTGEQLCKQIGFFTKEWLKRYGHSLPRTQAKVIDEKGVQHSTGWGYPLHRIQRMIQEGEIKNLKCMVVAM